MSSIRSSGLCIWQDLSAWPRRAWKQADNLQRSKKKKMPPVFILFTFSLRESCVLLSLVVVGTNGSVGNLSNGKIKRALDGIGDTRNGVVSIHREIERGRGEGYVVFGHLGVTKTWMPCPAVQPTHLEFPLTWVSPTFQILVGHSKWCEKKQQQQQGQLLRAGRYEIISCRACDAKRLWLFKTGFPLQDFISCRVLIKKKEKEEEEPAQKKKRKKSNQMLNSGNHVK